MEGHINHHAWLVNSGLFTDEMKDNIAMCGYCLVEEVLDSSTDIDMNEKIVRYKLTIPHKLYDNIMLLHKFERGENIGFFDHFKLKAFIKQKKQNDESGMGYRLEDIGNAFIRSYLNKEWSVEVQLFKEGDNEVENFGLRNERNTSVN